VIKLNLGASDDKRDGWLSVDIAPPADVVCDLREPWSWKEGEIEEIYAKDVAEHIGGGYRLNKVFQCLKCPNIQTYNSATGGSGILCRFCMEGMVLIDFDLVPFNGLIHFMNEAHRVLQPGGILELIVPCYPGEAAFCDPTHAWPLWTASTRYYFDVRWNHPRGERGRLGPTMAQGITALFKTVGGRSGPDWMPIQYAEDAPERRKLFLLLEAVK